MSLQAEALKRDSWPLQTTGPRNWHKAAFWRRSALLLVVCAQTAAAARYLADALPGHDVSPLELGLVAVFAALFAWISIGFWTTLAGVWVLIRGSEESAPGRATGARGRADDLHRTAVLMPIYNEEPSRVFAGLRAIYRSVQRAGALEHFDFYVLSDTTDPDKWVEEEFAWAELCRAIDDFQTIFYRRRRVNIKRKSGNVSDFCRRWGKKYRYMVVLDADSLMSGETLLKLVRLMESRPEAGIIQTRPQTVNAHSLYARIQQFTSRVHAPALAAGLHFWQLGDSHYWGHNAIIRVKPFIDHCGLPKLSGNPPFGGEILSHDFVEAALMRRAGWEVWLAHDLPGSYEECPPAFLDEAKRDRRWCQGNLQHLRLLGAQGLAGAHRALFLNGIMTYLSAPLWLLFLGLTTAEMAVVSYAQAEPRDFAAGHPAMWLPEQSPSALPLLLATAILLFLPKLLGAALLLGRRGETQLFGGTLPFSLSILAELLVSALLAPARMLFHAKFVILTLLGRPIRWTAQQREEGRTGWRDAFTHHGFGVALASTWAVFLWAIDPMVLWWFSPILLALLLAPLISVLTSDRSLGLAARRHGLFLIPEEHQPPWELRYLQSVLAAQRRAGPRAQHGGFLRAVIDPYVNAIHLNLLPRRGKVPPATAERLERLRESFLGRGPAGLSQSDKLALLEHGESMSMLHLRVWQLPTKTLRKWGLLDPATV